MGKTNTNEVIYQIPELFNKLSSMIVEAKNAESDGIFIEKVVDIYIQASDGLERITDIVDQEKTGVKEIYERLLAVKFKEFYDGMTELIESRLKDSSLLITSSF